MLQYETVKHRGYVLATKELLRSKASFVVSPINITSVVNCNLGASFDADHDGFNLFGIPVSHFRELSVVLMPLLVNRYTTFSECFSFATFPYALYNLGTLSFRFLFIATGIITCYSKHT
jgi:hypothetical protein